MNITEVIKIASLTRPKLIGSIGFDESNLTNNLPKSLITIYSTASGTIKNITDQKLMDLIPGYRLININELTNEIENFHNLYKALYSFTPFLADYSSGYVVINEKEGSIYRVSLEYGKSMVATSLEKFWETIYQCYENDAYYLDSDGYLDYDFDREGAIGLSVNPTCEYWCE